MDKLSNNNVKKIRLSLLVMIGAFLILQLLSVNPARSSSSSRNQPTCVGKVEIYHAIGDTTGMATVHLPAYCQFGTVFLSASSLIDGQPVIANYNLHQGELVIRTTFLTPLTAPVITEVSYEVIP